MHLPPTMQKFILYWDDMGAKLGISRSVVQIHALLHIAPDLLSADEICERLNLARSNAFTGLKELQSLGMGKSQRQLPRAEVPAHPAAAKARIKETLDTMQMFDGWYKDVSRLTRLVQMAPLRLGGRIARFLPKGKDG